MKRITEALARFVLRYSWWLLIAVLLLCGAAIPGATMLKPETGFDALVSSSSTIAKDNARYEEKFGGEPITILLAGNLDNIFVPANLAVLARFEQQFSADERYRSIISPLTVLEAAIEEANQQRQAFQQQLALAQEAAAAQAREAAAAMGLSEVEQELAAEQAAAEVLAEFQPQIEQMQLIGEPALDNPLFIAAVLYDDQGAISPEMQSLVPDNKHALILVTPQGNLNDDEELQVAVDVENFFVVNLLNGVEAKVIAPSKLVDAISSSMSNNLKILLGLAVAVMILVLMVLFRVRWRLLSLFMVGVGALWTFSLMGYVSIPLTMATMAVLPILIGLGIDYSIQFHNRYQEELLRQKTVGDAIVSSLSNMFPSVGIALLATIIGFITLYISEVPMIRDFGVALTVGIILCYLVAIFLLHSILYRSDKRAPIAKLRKESTEASGRTERTLLRVGKLAIRHTLWIFIIAVLFGVAGGVVDHWLPKNTDYEELMPQDIAVLKDVRELRLIIGSGGEIRFLVESDDVASPGVLSWLKGYEDEALAAHSELISVNSPAALVSEAAGGVIPPQEQIEAILAATPSLYLNRVLSADRTAAGVSFAIEDITMQEIHDLLQAMEAEAEPPAGVNISPVGSLALGSATMDSIIGQRFTMNLICLGAVFVVLLAVYRRLNRAIFTIIPVGAVIAWSSLDMYLIGIPLNPLTAVLGVIIIGICTEFMVLLTGRYEEERQQGHSPEEAMVMAISKIGRAIVITAVTTLGGFGVLIASNFVMIRDFGIATVISVVLCLVITIAVMPGVIVWYDNWRAKKRPKKRAKKRLKRA
jgi:hydrophobe/amphiphile efflux-3 (HAE3) family protein